MCSLINTSDKIVQNIVKSNLSDLNSICNQFQIIIELVHYNSRALFILF